MGTVRGQLPFKVVGDRESALHIPKYKHVVIDTKARPEPEDLRAIAQGCHLLVIPTTPDPLSLKAMLLTVQALQNIGSDRYRVLLSIVPPRPSRDGDEARELLIQNGIPVFDGAIRRLVAFQRAALEGTTVEATDRTGFGWQDYVRIGKQVEKLASRVVE
jgi:chromosome partitioning protein